jgi:hypothetical protein
MTTKQTRATPAPSRSRPAPTTRRVSPRAMREAMRSIAWRHFRHAFNEMVGYYGQANPNGHSYVQASLRAMREVLEDHERRADGARQARGQARGHARRVAA